MPHISSNDKGKNQPICANDAHIKATNNGFKRNALGGFFAHWGVIEWFKLKSIKQKIFIYNIAKIIKQEF